MMGKKLKFEDFGAEKISNDQQKMVRGGDGPDPTDGKDPNKGGGGTGGTP